MTYHQFNPSTDTLEVGTEFQLDGRNGCIDGVHSGGGHFEVSFFSPFQVIKCIDLTNFPSLMIADKSVKPLTIDKRVKEEIEKMLKEHRGCTPDSYYIENDCDKMLAYLNSLEET